MGYIVWRGCTHCHCVVQMCACAERMCRTYVQNVCVERMCRTYVQAESLKKHHSTRINLFCMYIEICWNRTIYTVYIYNTQPMLAPIFTLVSKFQNVFTRERHTQSLS